MVKHFLTLTVALGISIFSWSQSKSNFELVVESNGTTVNIQWRTLDYFNVESYEIYKLNGSDVWEIIETVEHDIDILTWSVTDPTPHSGENSYLLRAMEITGLPHFSGIGSIMFEAPEYEVMVYPNPASDWIIINSDETDLSFKAELVNRHGVSVAQAKSINGSILLDTSTVIEGIYYVKINNSLMSHNKPVVINHR